MLPATALSSASPTSSLSSTSSPAFASQASIFSESFIHPTRGREGSRRLQQRRFGENGLNVPSSPPHFSIHFSLFLVGFCPLPYRSPSPSHPIRHILAQSTFRVGSPVLFFRNSSALSFQVQRDPARLRTSTLRVPGYAKRSSHGSCSTQKFPCRLSDRFPTSARLGRHNLTVTCKPPPHTRRSLPLPPILCSALRSAPTFSPSWR